MGYQNNHAGKPYSHSLRQLLVDEGRCLACWATDHGVLEWPERPAAVKADMDKKKYVPPAVLNAAITEQTLQKTKGICTKDPAACGEPMCINTGPRASGEDVAEASGAVVSVVAEASGDVEDTKQSARATATHGI